MVYGCDVIKSFLDLNITASVIVGDENGFRMLSHGINVQTKSALCISGLGSIAERIKNLWRLGFSSRHFRFTLGW